MDLKHQITFLSIFNFLLLYGWPFLYYADRSSRGNGGDKASGMVGYEGYIKGLDKGVDRFGCSARTLIFQLSTLIDCNDFLWIMNRRAAKGLHSSNTNCLVVHVASNQTHSMELMMRLLTKRTFQMVERPMPSISDPFSSTSVYPDRDACGALHKRRSLRQHPVGFPCAGTV